MEKKCKVCAVCGDNLIDEAGMEQKKHEIFANYARICYECLHLPIRCVKGTITLNEVIRRISLLRRNY